MALSPPKAVDSRIKDDEEGPETGAGISFLISTGELTGLLGIEGSGDEGGDIIPGGG